jgi:hypothetical protein
MLLISVTVVGVVYAAYSFSRPFQEGVIDLGGDVKSILSTGSIGGVGRGGAPANGGNSGAPPAPSTSTGQPTTGAPTGPLGGPRTGTGTMNGGPIVSTDTQAPNMGDRRNRGDRVFGSPMGTLPGSAPPPRGMNDG